MSNQLFLKNKFIIDKEINLNERDFLKTKIYADNLTNIMQNGSFYQKGYVVKILTDKLDTNHDIEQTLTLIDSMENIRTFDKSGLLYSHLDNYQQQNKKSISKEIDEKIKQLKKRVK